MKLSVDRKMHKMNIVITEVFLPEYHKGWRRLLLSQLAVKGQPKPLLTSSAPIQLCQCIISWVFQHDEASSVVTMSGKSMVTSWTHEGGSCPGIELGYGGLQCHQTHPFPKSDLHPTTTSATGMSRVKETDRISVGTTKIPPPCFCSSPKPLPNYLLWYRFGGHHYWCSHTFIRKSLAGRPAHVMATKALSQWFLSISACEPLRRMTNLSSTPWSDVINLEVKSWPEMTSNGKQLH